MVNTMEYLHFTVLGNEHSIRLLTAIPAGERWTLKAILRDGSISRAGIYATRIEALEVAERIAKRIGAEFIR